MVQLLFSKQHLMRLFRNGKYYRLYLIRSSYVKTYKRQSIACSNFHLFATMIRISESLSISLSGATGFVSQMKDLDGRDITLMPQDRFLLGGPLILRGFVHKSIFHSQETRQASTPQNLERFTNAGLDCYLGGKAFWRTCAQFYFPMPYLRRKNNWIADNVKGKFLFVHEYMNYTRIL